MNAMEFSEAMNGINDRFIDEAINYKPEKKIIYPFFRRAAVCAAALVVVIALSVFVSDSFQKPQISLGSSLITEEEIPVENLNRGISLVSEEQNVSVRLSFRKAKNVKVSVSEGTITHLGNGKFLGEGTEIQLNRNSEIIWNIDSPETESVYKMKIETKKAKTELTLKFKKEGNLWVISQS